MYFLLDFSFSDGPTELNDGLKKFAVAMTLAITYAAKTGGIACLTGTSSNVIMKGYADE